MRTKFFLFVSFLIISPALVLAQPTCTINDLKFTLDDNNNQKQGLTVHLSMSVKGMLNKTGKVFVFICDEDGNYINSTVPNFCTTENRLCKITSYTPSYQNSKYDDFKTFVPYYVISKSLSNSTNIHELKIKVIVANDNNEAIASKFSSTNFFYSDWTSVCLLCQGKGKASCRFCGGFRQRPINNGYNIYYVMCQACNGTGQEVCTMCGGRGNMGTTYYASYINANRQQQGNPVIVPIIPNSGIPSTDPSRSTRQYQQDYDLQAGFVQTMCSSLEVMSDGVSRTILLQRFAQCQVKMRQIRREAAANGVRITESPYENMTAPSPR